MLIFNKIMETEQNKPKRGRPAATINWPEGEFTAGEVYHLNRDKVSRVSIHNKINRALEDGNILKLRKSQNKIGRPSFTYVKTGSDVANNQEVGPDEMDF